MNRIIRHCGGVSPLLALAVVVLLAAALQGCYSFTGAALPAHLNRVTVPLFDDSSQAGIAQFRETITRKITDKIESQSRLVLESDPTRSDAVLTGTILSYTDEPSQLGSGTERAITNRITIVVKAEFEDRVKNRKLFSQNFIGFADYAVGSYSAQQTAITSDMEQVSGDIFNRIVSDW